MEYNELYQDIKTFKREEVEVTNRRSPFNSGNSDECEASLSPSQTIASKPPPPIPSSTSSSNHCLANKINECTTASVTIPADDIDNKGGEQPQHMDVA